MQTPHMRGLEIKRTPGRMVRIIHETGQVFYIQIVDILFRKNTQVVTLQFIQDDEESSRNPLVIKVEDRVLDIEKEVITLRVGARLEMRHGSNEHVLQIEIAGFNVYEDLAQVSLRFFEPEKPIRWRIERPEYIDESRTILNRQSLKEKIQYLFDRDYRN